MGGRSTHRQHCCPHLSCWWLTLWECDRKGRRHPNGSFPKHGPLWTCTLQVAHCTHLSSQAACTVHAARHSQSMECSTIRNIIPNTLAINDFEEGIVLKYAAIKLYYIIEHNVRFKVVLLQLICQITRQQLTRCKHSSASLGNSAKNWEIKRRQMDVALLTIHFKLAFLPAEFSSITSEMRWPTTREGTASIGTFGATEISRKSEKIDGKCD